MILLIKIGLRHVAEPMLSNPQNLEFAKKTAMFLSRRGMALLNGKGHLWTKSVSPHLVG